MTAALVEASAVVPQDRVGLPVRAVSDPNIHGRQLTRQARVYVRPSHPNQVRHHPERARRQYGLTERAQPLGWESEQIRVLDEDQGKSGAGRAVAHGRDGVAELVSAVGLGQVGIVGALEVSRLARNSAAWYRVLERCALSGTLIADDTPSYYPRLFNDRLLRGLRGTISEVELPGIKERLDGARMSKARRGERPVRLPAGYVGGREGQIALDPDQEVHGAIRTIFAPCERLSPVTAVLPGCNDHGLKVPRRRWHAESGSEIVGMRPSYQALHPVLTNPTEAGASIYGRRGHDPDGLVDRGNPGPRKHGALEQGAGLLQGVAGCGRCGCRMHVPYGKPSAAYLCDTRHRRDGAPLCQSLTIEPIDHAIAEAFLPGIGPAQMEAALVLAEEVERDRAAIARPWELRLERARYEAERAFRQDDLGEPENRLAAREREGRGNET